MRFQASGSYEEGVTDVDPVANPDTILPGHVLVPSTLDTHEPASLDLVLLGSATESVTLTLYFLVETFGNVLDLSTYIHADARWFQFATGVVVTNGTLTKVTSDLPAGGVVYGRRTADTIGSSEIRPLLMAWIPQ